GLSGAGLELVDDARREGEGVVVIDQESSAEAGIRAEETGASLLPGSPAEPQLLRNAGVRRAKLILAATADDSANIAAVVQAPGSGAGETQRPRCPPAAPPLTG